MPYKRVAKVALVFAVIISIMFYLGVALGAETFYNRLLLIALFKFWLSIKFWIMLVVGTFFYCLYLELKEDK